MRIRAILDRTLASLRGEPVRIHSDLSCREAAARMREGFSGRWFEGMTNEPVSILGTATAGSVTAFAKRRDVSSAGTQVFKGRLVGDDRGCALIGSMRTSALVRAMFYLEFGLGLLGTAEVLGVVVWYGMRGDLSPAMLGGAFAVTSVPLVVFCVYAGAVAFSASDAVHLRAWLSERLTSDDAGRDDDNAARPRYRVSVPPSRRPRDGRAGGRVVP